MIPIYKPSIKRKEMDALLSSLIADSSEALTNCSDFIKELSEYTGMAGGYLFRDFATAVRTTVASLDLEPGSRIVVSPLSDYVYISETENLGFQPVYADIDTVTGCMEKEEVLKHLEAGASAVITFSPSGVAQGYDFLSEYPVPVIEDSTNTIGLYSSDEPDSWKPDFCLVRMELSDLLTAGEGTAVLSESRKKLSALKSSVETLPVTAFLLEMHAAVGLVQLKTIEKLLHRRREIGEAFEASIMKGRHSSFREEEGVTRNYPGFPVVLNSPVKEVSNYARKQGVATDLAFKDCALSFRQIEGCSVPNASSILPRTLKFPLYPALGSKNTETVIKLLSTLP